MKGLSRWLTGLCLIAGAMAPSYAQWAPTKPIKMIVPYAPGGAADLTARLMAEQLALALGQPMIVENRAGGGGDLVHAIGKSSRRRIAGDELHGFPECGG